MKKVIGIVFIIFFVATVGSSLAYRIFNYDGILQKEQDLKVEFQSIIQPVAAQELDIKIRGKIVKRWLVARYKYDMTDENVEKYYMEELSKEGWVRTGVRNIPNKRFRTSIYTKGMYEVSIGAEDDYWVIIMNYRDIFNSLGL